MESIPNVAPDQKPKEKKDAEWRIGKHQPHLESLSFHSYWKEEEIQAEEKVKQCTAELDALKNEIKDLERKLFKKKKLSKGAERKVNRILEKRKVYKEKKSARESYKKETKQRIKQHKITDNAVVKGLFSRCGWRYNDNVWVRDPSRTYVCTYLHLKDVTMHDVLTEEEVECIRVQM